MVLYYDYFLTLGDEITHVWRVRKTASVWLFFVNRYYPLLIVRDPIPPLSCSYLVYMNEFRASYYVPQILPISKRLK